MVLLIVEDDNSIAQVLDIMLCMEEPLVECHHATTIQGAIEEMRKKKPDIILLDYILEDGLGDTLVKYVREVFESPPLIILMSASNQTDAIGERLKIVNVLKKPFRYEELRKMIYH